MAVITVTAGETWGRTLQGKGTCREPRPGQGPLATELFPPTTPKHSGGNWLRTGRKTYLPTTCTSEKLCYSDSLADRRNPTYIVSQGIQVDPNLWCQNPGVRSPLGSNMRPQRLCHHSSVRFLTRRAEVLSSASEDLILTCQLLSK